MNDRDILAVEFMNEKEAKERIAALKREIAVLRKQLNQAGSQKRALLKERTELEEQIGSSILKASEAKSRRDELTTSVRKEKASRSEVQKKIKERVKEAYSIRNRVMGLRKDARLPSPEAIDQQIRRIEEVIETQAISFEKEKKLMKRIKGLKKQKEASQKIAEIAREERARETEIWRLKEESHKIHQNVQREAEKSQDEHKRLVDSSKKAGILKEKWRTVQGQLSKEKERMKTLSNQLKERVTELSQLSVYAKSYADRRKEEEERKKDKRLEELKRKAEEKLRNKEKLTTKDILALQG